MQVPSTDQERVFIDFQEALAHAVIDQDLERYISLAWSNYNLTKQPDSAYSFFRFFSALESASLPMAHWDWNAIIKKATPVLGELVSESWTPITEVQNIYVLPGNTSLANALILYEAIRTLGAKERTRIGLVLMDESNNATAGRLEQDLGVSVISLGHLGFTWRRLALLYIVSNSRHLAKVHFWSIPIDIPMASLAIRGLRRDLPIVHTTTKYSYPFRKIMVDLFVSSPGLEYYPRQDDYIAADFYSYPQEDMMPKMPTDREELLLKELTARREKGDIIITSFARPEKLQSSDYISVFRHLEGNEKKCTYLLFGNQRPNEPILGRLVSFGIDVISCGFCHLANFCHLVDIYIDPVPHGGGFSFLLSAMHGIPSIVPLVYSAYTKNPSAINLVIDNPALANGLSKEFKILFRKCFPRSEEDLKEGMRLLARDPQHRNSSSDLMRFVYAQMALRSNKQEAMALLHIV